jgi:transcriptional regulator with PAS, ATPase and Fis domain
LLESELFGYEKGAFTGAEARKQGKLEAADGGTIFFDEIGDMSLHAQAKILRAIETRQIQRLGGLATIPVAARFIAATNHDIERLVREDKFRKDLYFRLNVGRIHLPPLRERREDIPALSAQFIRQLNRQFERRIEGLCDDAWEPLLAYDWPGNVRELRNVLEATFLADPPDRIAFSDLPPAFRNYLGGLAEALPSERERMLAALFSTHWNVTRAAQKLKWSRMTFYRKMAKHRIAGAR